MTAVDVKKGDKVRVVIEGEVDMEDRDIALRIKGYGWIRPDPTEYVSVEVIEPAKPEWWPLRDGDVFDYAAHYPRYVIDGEARTSRGELCENLGWYNNNAYLDRITLLYRPDPEG